MAYTNFAAQLEALRNGVPSSEVFGGGVGGTAGMTTANTGNFGSNVGGMYDQWGVDPNANPFQGQLDKAFGAGNSPYQTYDQQMSGTPADGMKWFGGLGDQYQNLLGREMDASGQSYWQNLDRTTNLTDAELQTQFMQGVNAELASRAPAAGVNARRARRDPTKGATGYDANPYMGGIADDITRRSQDALGQSLNMIGGAAVGVGGLGGSRQGVAQGQAITGANDNLTGQLANLYGTDWTNSQNRELQRYGIDQNYALGMANVANQRYGIDQNYNLGMTNANNNFTLGSNAQRDNFYNTQRGQDLTALGIGSNLFSNTLNTFAGSTGSSGMKDSGFDWQGALGGLWGGLQLGNNFWKP